jgi:hypothetical protein
MGAGRGNSRNDRRERKRRRRSQQKKNSSEAKDCHAATKVQGDHISPDMYFYFEPAKQVDTTADTPRSVFFRRVFR